MKSGVAGMRRVLDVQIIFSAHSIAKNEIPTTTKEDHKKKDAQKRSFSMRLQ